MSYRVTLPKTFPYDQRVRAGITVSRQDGYEGDLTDDQLAAIKADPLLTVTSDKPAAHQKQDTKPASSDQKKDESKTAKPAAQ